MRASAYAWVGVFGPPAAWLVQHIGGWSIGLADCPDNAAGPGWNVPVDALTAGLGGVAAFVVVLCELASVAAWRSTRGIDETEAPPAGRVHFLALIGMTIGPLFLAIIVMSSTGALVFNGCTQS